MNREEFEARRKLIKKQCNEDIKKLANEYAIEHNPVNIGDIVTDHMGSIKVERIGVYLTRIYAHPSCFYIGTCCTKAGYYLKSGGMRRVNQNNLK